MTIGEYISCTTKRLRRANVTSARLDCLILLEDALGEPRAHLLAHNEQELPAAAISTLDKKIAQRATHLPLAYIRGHAAFFGREFIVTPNVLVPRPESEAIIELLKNLPLPAVAQIADIGTGSGCLGITAALELPDCQVTLCDISPAALGVARQNAQKLDARVAFKRQNILTDDQTPYDVVLANLPYVPAGFPINDAARHEPPLALFAGIDGLDLYKLFWRELASRPQPEFILTESMTGQHHAIAMLARQAGYVL